MNICLMSAKVCQIVCLEMTVWAAVLPPGLYPCSHLSNGNVRTCSEFMLEKGDEGWEVGPCYEINTVIMSNVHSSSI